MNCFSVVILDSYAFISSDIQQCCIHEVFRWFTAKGSSFESGGGVVAIAHKGL